MKPSNIRDLVVKIGTELGDLYADPAEGKSVAELLLASLLNTNRAGLYGIGGKIDDPQMLGQIQQCFDRLLKNEPLQYVLGKTWFCGLELMVAPGVLIPRPESEELVEWVVKNHEYEQHEIEIVDIGTGSGCLALALKSKMPGAMVTGVDISEPALALSSKNAARCHLDVNWLKLDILSEKCPVDTHRKLVVVSNPPYVLESEKASMDERVKMYEPESALFVPDSDPLLFYRRIVEVFKPLSSVMYFEINPLAKDLFFEMAKSPEFKIEVKSDFCGKSRMIRIGIAK